MTPEQVINLPGKDNPVLLADGRMGMLILYPAVGDECGVQVYGELDCRKILASDLIASRGGALRQVGAPTHPPVRYCLVHMFLVNDWVERGGHAIKENQDV